MSTKKESAFIKEFKTFISQGNVMDLAVGMVIGSSFSAIVASLVNDIIMPVVGIIIGGVDFSSLSIDVPNFFGGHTAAHVQYGSFIQAAVNFIIIAFSLFMVIKFINRMNEKNKSLAEKVAAKAKEAKEAAKEKIKK